MDGVGLGFSALLLVGLQSFAQRAFGWRALRYQRGFSRIQAFEGEEVELIEIIQNRKPLPVPWLRVESRMSPSLAFGAADTGRGSVQFAGRRGVKPRAAQDELEIEGERYHRSVFFLGAYSKITRRHRVRLMKRGHYPVGSVAMTGGDLFGLSQWTRQSQTGAVITVYPRLLDERELDPPSSRWLGDLLARRWIISDPFLIGGVRPYQAGDMPRDVHWAASARTGSLQVKMREHTADPRLFVILNVQAQENQWTDLMEYEQSRIERGISIAATLIVKALRAGVEAGFAANAPVFESTEPLVIPARCSATQADEVLDALARLTIKRARSFPTFIDDLGNMTGAGAGRGQKAPPLFGGVGGGAPVLMNILILSCYDSELIQERISALRAMGNTVELSPLSAL
ncbi:MAG: DUF58 domain-containing protein [Oscillospiraceae bacterium]|jgi:uncharacterized protein (DUF58 family)|nr:DUF58 domain-containing protein [Oscillospiraceae bacterium]